MKKVLGILGLAVCLAGLGWVCTWTPGPSTPFNNASVKWTPWGTPASEADLAKMKADVERQKQLDIEYKLNSERESREWQRRCELEEAFRKAHQIHVVIDKE